MPNTRKININLLANYLGQGWVAVMGFAFTPLYISYLGIEAFSIIGFFAILHAWFALLDMGISPTISREMARLSGCRQGDIQIRNLLRTCEILMLCIMLFVFSMMFLFSDPIAHRWLNPETTTPEHLSFILVIMGAVIALRLGEGVYRGALMGLQRQVLFNSIYAALSTFRWLGSVLILELVSPTLFAFFVWQGLVSFISLIILAFSTYKVLPYSNKAGIFVVSEVRRVSNFASGMFGISILTTLLIHTDKLILSKMLGLAELGYYYLATSLSGSLMLLTTPIMLTWYPRLCELNAADDRENFAKEYHLASQLVMCTAGSLWAVLFFFTKEIIFLWTGNAELTTEVTLLMKVLLVGNLLSCLLYIPYQAQLAYGWTSLSVKMNFSAIFIIIPALIFSINKYGTIGAASVWLLLNLAYFFIGTFFMYRRILQDEKHEWFVMDIFVPLTSIMFVTSALWYCLPEKIDDNYLIAYLIFSAIFILTTSALFSSRIKAYLFVYLNAEFTK